MIETLINACFYVLDRSVITIDGYSISLWGLLLCSICISIIGNFIWGMLK